MRYHAPLFFGALAPEADIPPALWWCLGAALAVLGAAWFVLVLWLFQRLRKRHAATYETIGSPSLIWNNSLRSNWLFIKFLYSPRALELDDESASCVVGVLRVLLPGYYVVFIVLMILFMVMMFA